MFLPLIYIKLGLIKNFVKTLERTSPTFSFLCENLPRLSAEKIEADVFTGHLIRQLLRDAQFDLAISNDGKTAWNAYRHAATCFLGNVKSVSFWWLAENFVTSCKKLGCNTTRKMHFLHSHLDSSPVNSGALSDEHGELLTRTSQR